MHLEEDTGKLFHVDSYSLVDFNRSGVPLLEIVSEPDLHSVEDVKAYATKLRTILRYLGGNNGDLEKGVIRFEANVSVRPAGTANGTPAPGSKTSTRSAPCERQRLRIERQSKIYEAGGRVEQKRGAGTRPPAKPFHSAAEQAHDYRYFPPAGYSAAGD